MSKNLEHMIKENLEHMSSLERLNDQPNALVELVEHPGELPPVYVLSYHCICIYVCIQICIY